MDARTKDAIQEDVSIQTEEEQQEEQQPVLSERELAMQAIQAEIDQRYGEPAYPHKPVTDEAPENPEQKEEKEAPAAAATPEPPATVRVKVDGEEKELPLADVIKGFQKDSVASKRLEEAAQKDRTLTAREAALAERERQIQASTATLSQEDDDDDEIQAAINALVDGDNATAAKLLRDAVKKGRQAPTPAPDPAALAAQIKADLKAESTAEANARQFQEFAAANPIFAEPQADEEGRVILSKERVRGDYLFDTLYGPDWQAGKISYREALDKTAAHVAKEFTPAAPAPPPPLPNEREARKAKIDNIPHAHGAKQVTAPKVQTPEEVLDEMKRARGQFV